MQLYRSEGSNPKWNAQRNLSGRTHYVDDDTLKFHKARIISSRATDGGLLFALVESVALDYQNTKRGYRYVIFDIFGHVISRVDLENCWRSSEKATKAMWAALNQIDAKEVTLKAIDKAQQDHRDEMQRLSVMVAQIETATP